MTNKTKPMTFAERDAAIVAIIAEFEDLVKDPGRSRYLKAQSAIDQIRALMSHPVEQSSTQVFVEDATCVAINPPEFPKIPAFIESLTKEDIWLHACLTGWRCAQNQLDAINL